MSIFDSFRMATQVASRTDSTLPIASPWNSPNHLKQIVLTDLLGDSVQFPLSRIDAMRVPSIAKARSLICGTAAHLPLIAYRGGTEMGEQPTWLYRTDSPVSPQQRMLWTMDDLFLHGWSLWAVQRGSGDQITDAMRVPLDWWELDDDGQVLVSEDGDEFKPVSASEVILFSGPQEGMVDLAARAIRAYKDLENTRASRLRNPIASIVLHATEEMNLTDEEVQELVNDYADSHSSSGLAISWLPHNVNVEEHGEASPDLFLQVENAINVQIAQFANIPATLLDAAIEGSSSLTYQNTHQTRSWFLDTALNYWLSPVESRLSMDDCVPRGQAVHFDVSSLTTFPPEPTIRED